MMNNLSGLALAMVASAAVLGFAAAPAEAAEVKVRVAAHELATAQGQAAVNGRLEAAAKVACGYVEQPRDAVATSLSKYCVVKTLEDARAKVAEMKARTQMAALDPASATTR
jgi:UrcA family protein